MTPEVQDFLNRYKAILSRDCLLGVPELFSLPLSLNYAGHILIINNHLALTNYLEETHREMRAEGHCDVKIVSAKQLESAEDVTLVSIVYDRFDETGQLIFKSHGELTLVSTDEGLKITAVVGDKINTDEAETTG